MANKKENYMKKGILVRRRAQRRVDAEYRQEHSKYSEPVGLREQIAEAETMKQVNTLLTKGLAFEYAGDRTKRSWQVTAKNRFKSLDSYVAPKVESGDAKKVSVKKKKS